MPTFYEQYHMASAKIDGLIELTPTPTDTSREAIRQRASYRMDRLQAFLTRLGNPHQGLPVVHVGGTSGKGSTSTTIAAMLTAAGHRTGLHTSPYLQSPLEKLQINGQLCSAERFVELVDSFFAEHDRWLAEGREPLTYGEAWAVLTWLFFRAEQCDVAVVEVGAGGRFDLTNILSPTLAVITSVGIDHTATLGTTVEQIAWHKAGIIKATAPALSAVADPVAGRIMAEEANTVGTVLIQLAMDREIADVQTTPEGTTWREVVTGQTHRMRMCGSFQALNGQTAVRAARLLRELGVAIPDEAITTGLLQARIPGRAEYMPASIPTLFDGAHNPQKIGALVKDLPSLLPRRGEGRRICITGLLNAKDGSDIIQKVVGDVDVLIATSPQVFGKDAKASSAIQALAAEAGFRGAVYADPAPRDALERALSLAQADDVLLVTGSLYLVGNVRGRFYSEEAIVAERSSWPEGAGAQG